MKKVSTEEELGEALKNDEDEIEIEGKIKDTVIKIKARGKIAWVVAIGAIGVAIAAIIAGGPTAGTTLPAGAVALAPAAAALGGSNIALSAVMIGVAAGGVGALNRLRRYRIVSKNSHSIIIRK